MRACRLDANHVEMVDALKSKGYRVLSLASHGHGVPDVLIHREDTGFRLVEIKTEKGKLRKQQEGFMAKGWPVTVIRSVEDIP